MTFSRPATMPVSGSISESRIARQRSTAPGNGSFMLDD
jgi:hypothetical protein